jgi:SHS2 domain-containing protein
MSNPTPKRFEEVEHTADAALRAYGRDWGELFVNAAYGMFSLMADWEDNPLTEEQEISLQAIDGETLLVDWLSELLYLHEMEDVIYTSFQILDISPTTLRAIARGTERWNPQTAIKAVTFNDLRIVRLAEGYAVTIVFDT